MINKKLAFGFIAVVAFATPAAAQQAQTSVQSANTQNAAVNGSTAISNRRLRSKRTINNAKPSNFVDKPQK
ncbi:MAG: hypothetical protein GVY04_13815 [Cyanobacteria bacterium]|jgi:uncharacterized protein YegL|nr:hypothetical protein [Cyanobacteria bacterium GSL.Bin1]